MKEVTIPVINPTYTLGQNTLAHKVMGLTTMRIRDKS